MGSQRVGHDWATSLSLSYIYIYVHIYIYIHTSMYFSPLCSIMRVCMHAQLCPALCNPMDYRLPNSSVHGIFLARILERVAIFSSRGSSWPRDWICISWVSYIHRLILYHWATWEVPCFIIGYCIQLNKVLYSRPLLFIHSIYKSLHLLTPTSHSILLPTPSFLATTNLFSISMILFLFHK